jgi:hypothetical protein
MNKARRRFRLASLAVALTVGALAAILMAGLSATPAGAQAPPPSGGQAIDCDAATAGVQSECFVASGADFVVQVHVTEAPTGGFTAFQSKIRWTDANLDYVSEADPAAEALWPSCTIPARAIDDPATGTNNPAGTSAVLYACAPFPELTTGDTTTGAVLQFTFTCVLDETTTLRLVPRTGDPEIPAPGNDPQLGSHFLVVGGFTVDPATLASATINCGAAPPTATPTTPSGGETPVASPTSGAAPTALPSTGFGQEDGGQGGSPWLLIGAAALVAAAGLSLFGWRYAHRRR